jgi:phosphate-selective porin OprO/OprP
MAIAFRRSGPVIAMAALLLAGGVSQAQAPDATTAILERLDRLERQNEELRKKVQTQEEQLRHQTEELQRRPVPAAPEADGEAVRKVVDDYLKQKNAGKAEATSTSLADQVFEVGKDLKFNASWKDGFYAETADKAFRFRLGGDIDIDSAWYGSSRALSNSIGQFNNFFDPNTGLSDGADVRRARVRFDGGAYEVMDFRLEFDLANALDLRRRTLGVTGTPPATGTIYDQDPANGVRMNDIYMAFRDLPFIGTVTAGHQREFLEFSTATSFRFQTFIERPLIFDAFNGDYQWSLGITAARNWLPDDRAYTWVGVFRANNTTQDSTNFIGGFDTGDGDYVYDARVTFLPVWENDGTQWVHVGFDYSYRNLDRNMTRFRALPSERGSSGFEVPNIINTGTIFSADAQQNFNVELASGFGPLTLTAEYGRSVVGNTYTGGLPLFPGKLPAGVAFHGDYLAQGYYVEALYFLTGDHRNYRKEQPGYDRVRPRENFYFLRDENGHYLWGRGAWEVAARYDYLDLSNNGINGGLLHALTFGVNWHLNPNMKVQWNYTWMQRNFEPTNTTTMLPGDINSFGVRFHCDF